MVEYKLLNPSIEGSLENSFSGNTPIDAAKKAWSTLSGNFSNFTPKFAFTIGNVRDNSMHHFTVREHIKNGKVYYSVSNLKKNPTAAKIKTFKNKLNQKNSMAGGRRKRKSTKSKRRKGGKDDSDDSDKPDPDDSDSDSDDDDLYDIIREQKNSLQPNSPVWWFWYYPTK